MLKACTTILAKRCENFRPFTSEAGLYTVFFVVITVTHIAAISNHVEGERFNILLLILIEIVHNVQQASFPDFVFRP